MCYARLMSDVNANDLHKGLSKNERINISRSQAYVNARLEKLQKSDSALVAGYGNNKAINPSRIEITKGYKYAVEQSLNKTANLTMSIIDNLLENKDKLKELKPIEQIEIALKLAKIHQIFTPTVTIKEETRKDGTVKRTQWATAGAKLPSDKENTSE